jgi:hypothetical protein
VLAAAAAAAAERRAVCERETSAAAPLQVGCCNSVQFCRSGPLGGCSDALCNTVRGPPQIGCTEMKHNTAAKKRKRLLRALWPIDVRRACSPCRVGSFSLNLLFAVVAARRLSTLTPFWFQMLTTHTALRQPAAVRGVVWIFLWLSSTFVYLFTVPPPKPPSRYTPPHRIPQPCILFLNRRLGAQVAVANDVLFPPPSIQARNLQDGRVQPHPTSSPSTAPLNPSCCS